MNKFWDVVIKPMLEEIKPNHIIEVGSDNGYNTKNLLEYAHANNSFISVIDPFPKYNAAEWEEEYRGFLKVYKELSLSRLGIIDNAQVILLDGDHNWYTVYNELKLIEKQFVSQPEQYPLILLHDIGWPYARRDLYYNPDNIPSVYRQPYEKKGILPQNTTLNEDGLNNHLNNAIYENNFQNGVLTGIEDYIKESEINLNFYSIDGFNGLGILFNRTNIAIDNFIIKNLDSMQKGIIELIEQERVYNQIILEQKNKDIKAKNKKIEEIDEKIKKSIDEVLSIKKLLISKEEEIKSKEEEIKSKEEEISIKDKDLNQILYFKNEMTYLLKEKSKLQKELEDTINKKEMYKNDCATHLNSAKYRIGDSLVKGMKSPIDFIKIPYRLASIIRSKKKGKKIVQASKKSNSNCERYSTRRLKVSVVCWDLCHNPLGRGYLLAEALSKHYDVEIIGNKFEKYGKDIWEPLRDQKGIEIKGFDGANFPDYYSRMQEIAKAIEGDVILISKPRLPSMELAIMAKTIRNRPLILDIDDYELSFFTNRETINIEQLKQCPKEELAHEPFNNTWTRYSEHLIKQFNYITVSNEELQRKYGGQIIHHARNAEIFSPELYNRKQVRSKLGYSEEDKVILFIGTPRRHKGIFKIAEAVSHMKEQNYKLCIVGNIVDKDLVSDLDKLDKSKIKILSNCKFRELPKYLSVGDLYVIIQDTESETAMYQMPAKFTDALAMGIPILGNSVGPLKALNRRKLLNIIEEDNLEVTIKNIFNNYDIYKAEAMKNRTIFLEEYSSSAVGNKLKDIVEQALNNNSTSMPKEFTEILKLQSELFKKTFTLANLNKMNSDAYDLVFIWKQNDSNLYGRRPDMIIEQLSKLHNVENIVHFDAPIDIEQLIRGKVQSIKNKYTHFNLIFISSIKGYLGHKNINGIKSYTYIYKKRGSKIIGVNTLDGYEKYVKKILIKHNIGVDNKVLLWNSPINYQFDDWIKWTQPDIVVSDIIDDQRAWTNNLEIVRKMTHNYNAALKKSDHIFVNCNEVRERLSVINPYVKGKIHLVPNGGEEYNDKPFKKPFKLKRIKGPIIGYVGNLSVKIDIDLIRRCAVQHPEWQIILIGSTHMNKEIMSLKKHKNIHLLGVVPYKQVKQYISNFDVAIMPHKKVKINEAMNPLKLFVYCAMGKNVVSTDIQNIDELSSIIHIAKNEEEFISKVQYVLDNKHKFSKDEIKLINNNSWQVRINEIKNIIFNKKE